MSDRSLNEFPLLSLFSPNDGKFIVVILSDNKGAQKTVVCGGDKNDQHYNLFEKFKEIVHEYNFSATCIGGGKYLIVPDEREVFIWSESFHFGKEPDRSVTLAIFRETCPGFKVSSLNFSEMYTKGLNL